MKPIHAIPYLLVSTVLVTAACGPSADPGVGGAGDGGGTAADTGGTGGSTGEATAGGTLDCDGNPGPACFLGEPEVHPGGLCLPIANPCTDPNRIPDRLEVREDGKVVYSFFYRFQGDEPEPMVCLSVDVDAPEERYYEAQARCGDEVHEAWRTVVVEPPLVRVEFVGFDEPIYGDGDTVRLRVVFDRPGFTARMDLSGFDPAFSQDAVVDEMDPDTYVQTLSYDLTPGLPGPVEAVRVPVEILDGEGQLVQELFAVFRYAPEGIPTTVLGRGFLRLADPPERAPSPWTIESVYFGGAPEFPGNPENQARFLVEHDAGIGLDLGQPIDIVIRTPQGADVGPWVTVEARQEGHDGYFVTSGATTPLGCDASGCTHAVRISVQVDPQEIPNLGDLDLRVLDPTAASTAWSPMPLTNHPTPPTYVTFRGRIRVKHRLAVPSTESDDPSQRDAVRVSSEFVPEGALLRIDDGCGATRWALVGADGRFSALLKTNCVELDQATVTLHSVTSAGPGRVAVAGWAGEGTPDGLTDLSKDAGDYRIYTAEIGNPTVTPVQNGAIVEFGESIVSATPLLPDEAQGVNEVVALETVFALVGMDSVRRALDYFTRFDGVELHEFPSVNVVADRNLCLMDDTSSDPEKHAPCDAFGAVYWSAIAPGFVLVQEYLRSERAVYIHETSHIFESHFLRSGQYNTFHEPNANLMAYAVLQVGGLAEDGWLSILRTDGDQDGVGSATNNVDSNGKWYLGNGVAKQPVLRPFFATVEEAALQALLWTTSNGRSCALDDEGNPATTEAAGSCVMGQAQWAVARVMYDLFDGAMEAAEPVLQFEHPTEGTVLDTVVSFDRIQGNGAAGDAATHRYVRALLDYLGAKGVPEFPYYVDRGQPKVDLVDVLDAMVCMGGMTEADAGVLLGQVHAYGYDYAPPAKLAGHCP